jgi:hypothetical protein
MLLQKEYINATVLTNKLTVLIQRRIVVVAGRDIRSTRGAPKVGSAVVLIIFFGATYIDSDDNT